MPPLALVYVVLVSAMALATLSTQIKDGAPLWYWLLNLGAMAIMLLLFTGYWIKGLVEGIRLLAPALFAFSLLWEIFSARREIPRGIDKVGRDAPAAVRLIGKRLNMAL